MPLPTPTTSAASTTPVRSRAARSYVTRAATVATTSAAAALLAVLPAGPAPAPTTAAAPAAAALPAPAPVPVVSAPVAHVAASTAAAPAAGRAASAVQFALGKVGAPYRWGGTGPSSFDWAFDRVGVDLPRTSRALSRVGTPVSRANLQPGDLVFFYSPVSHVGIYIGDGRMVHASTSGKPVAVSSISGRPFHSARRVA